MDRQINSCMNSAPNGRSMNERTVTMSRLGIFTARRDALAAHVYCDAAHPDGRWIVTLGGGDGVVPSPLSWHEDLDAALEVLAATVGFDGKFSVQLPCSTGFLRPGRVPAVQVLAALGYFPARGITSYVVMESDSDADAEHVRETLVGKLANRSVCVGDMSLVEIENGSSVWCCDVNLPFEGPLSDVIAREYVSREFDGSGLDVADCVEIVPFTLVDPHHGSVIEMKPALSPPKAA